MSIWYLDTSAALKLVVSEAESDALAARLDDDDVQLVGCLLLETELRRACHRIEGLEQEHVTDLLLDVGLQDMTPDLYRTAGLLPGRDLRSLDALHLAAATRLDVDAVCTYDRRMAAAALSVGLVVQAPGA